MRSTSADSDLASHAAPRRRALGAAAAPGIRHRPLPLALGRAGDDRAARAADPVRARRARAHPAADRHADRLPAGGGGPGHARRRSRRPPLVADHGHAGRTGAARRRSQPQGRVPLRAARRAQPRGPRDARAGRRAARGHARVTAALQRTFSSLAVPNYRRYFVGQVVSISGNWMQIVAEMWLVVQLTGSGTAVGVTAGLQFLPVLLFAGLGRRAGRPVRQAHAAHRHAAVHGAAGARALGAHGRRPDRDLDGLRAGARARDRDRDRQPRAPVVRDRDGRRRARRERGGAELRDRPFGAHRRAGGGRAR